MNDLTVNARTSNTPSQYTARNSIMFSDGFETSASDSFVTSLNTNLAVCNPPVDSTIADGSTGSTVSSDAFNLLLNYYNNDYTGIQASLPSAFINNQLGSNFRPLYNGNISSIGLNVGKLSGPMLYNYQYDQLNRLVGMDAYRSGTAVFTSLQATSDFHETAAYDANGNITNYLRNGNTNAGLPLQMDNLTYQYKPNTNQLDHVNDAVNAANYPNDIDDQSNGNYRYDAIGNMTADAQSGIDSIQWTVYGKIQSIHKTDNSSIQYTYDAAGNRISKTVIPASGNPVTTWYVRDAQGNILDVYTAGNTTINGGHLSRTEINLYGSSRLGLVNDTTDVQDTSSQRETTNLPGLSYGNNFNFIRGRKVFELNNHLGNVLATVSDRRNIISTNDSTVDHYEAAVVNATDYYPFGMEMPGRVWNGGGYRYGFNGQEKSMEINDNNYTAEFWQYDGRLGRRWNLDVVEKGWISGYATFGNNPLLFVDPDGADWYRDSKGNAQWFDGHGKHKGYSYVGKDDQVVFSGGTKLEDVVISSSKPGKKVKKDAGTAASHGFYWYNSTKTEREGWKISQYNYYKGNYSAISPEQLRMYRGWDQAEKEYKIMSVAAVTAIALPAAAESGALSYFAPSVNTSLRAANIAGGVSDLINQGLIQGRGLRKINFGSTLTSTFLGGSNYLLSASWSASGNFLNLSYDGIISGNFASFNRNGLNSFVGGIAGNLIIGNRPLLKPLFFTGVRVHGTAMARSLIAGTNTYLEFMGNMIANGVEKQVQTIENSNK